MTGSLSRDEILTYAIGVARSQAGGALATMHADDGTPYVTFVLCHVRDDGVLLFGSERSPQHVQNIAATHEVSFLLDTRQVLPGDPDHFDRVVIEGFAAAVPPSSADYATYIDELKAHRPPVAQWAERGALYAIRPRRLILIRGQEPARHVIDFDER